VHILREHFRKQSRLLGAAAAAADGIGHAATTGRLRENVIKTFLPSHLPAHISIRSGVIIDSTGAKSSQQDCVLVDNRFPLNDVGAGTDSLMLAESVVATIEIKSYLDKPELLGCLSECLKVQRLKRVGQHRYRKGPVELTVDEPWPILYYVLALDGSELQTLMGHMGDAPELKQHGACPEAICVLSKGVISKSKTRPNVVGSTVHLPPAAGTATVTFSSYAHDALFAFYRRVLDDVMPLRLELVDIDRYYDSPMA
jgi:hypothetical protein